MDKLERERLVADAILLERAAAVLERRDPDLAQRFKLRAVAARFRREAESAPVPVPAGMQCENYPLCRCRQECGRG